MRAIRVNVLFALVFISMLTDAPRIRSQSVAPQFPHIETENLEGKKYSLPRDFESERNLVLIAFEREQQSNVDTWLHQIARLQELAPAMRIYELPTIARLDPFRRWFINTGMRHGIRDRKARERTLTLYLDKNAFKQSLAIESEKQIYPMLVDRSGHILWRSQGDFDEPKARSLDEVLVKLHQ